MDEVREGYQRIRHKLLHEGWDYVTVVSGTEGTGKSNLGLLLATYEDPEFDGTAVAFTMNDLLPLLERAPKASTVIFDEAVQGAYRRDAMTSENRTLNKAAMIARKRGIHLVLCIPNFWDLDSYFRDHRAKVWFLMERRNMALVHFPKRNRYKREVFWEPSTYYDHPNVGPGIWLPYDQTKDAYIARELRNARDPEAEATEKAAEVKAEALQRDRDLANEIKANGLDTIPAIMAQYGVGKHRAAALRQLAWGSKGKSKGGRPRKERPPSTPGPILDANTREVRAGEAGGAP